MERLTFVDEDGMVLFDNQAGFPEDVGFTIRELAESEDWETLDNIAQRLANCEQRLKYYKDLEEQERLLKLPCAVGDTVYHLCIFENGESEIIEMKVVCVEPCGAIRQHKGLCEIWNIYAETDYTKAYFKFFDFGKTVFLTKEAAEAALKEMSE